MAEHGGYSPAYYKTKCEEDNKPGDEHAKDEKNEEEQTKHESINSISSTPPVVATNNSPTNGPMIGTVNRSPRKKLDSLLKMAEIREAAKANGNNGGVHNHSNSKEEKKPTVEKQNGQQHSGMEQVRDATAIATAMPAPLPIVSEKEVNNYIANF